MDLKDGKKREMGSSSWKRPRSYKISAAAVVTGAVIAYLGGRVCVSESCINTHDTSWKAQNVHAEDGARGERLAGLHIHGTGRMQVAKLAVLHDPH
jgi:hypothetical protein